MTMRVVGYFALILLSCHTPASAWVAEARANLGKLGEASLDAYWAFAAIDEVTGIAINNGFGMISGDYSLRDGNSFQTLESVEFLTSGAMSSSRTFLYTNVAEGRYFTFTYGLAECGLTCDPPGDKEDSAYSSMVEVVLEDPPPTEDDKDPLMDHEEDPWDSPLVLDLDRGGFRFTDTEHGVEFDIDADGERETVAWTEAGSGDAFLVLDRNSNGIVDDGSEFFGDATFQPASSEPNGFEALAVFDWPENGGNGDGEISRTDAVYDSLALWIDTNHDGFSQYDELNSLEWHEISAVNLKYKPVGRTDRYGNQLRYIGSFTIGAVHQGRIVDVFFLSEE